MATSAHDPAIERVLLRIRHDGILQPPDTILRAVERPDWEAIRSLHDWRRHVPSSLRSAWDTLPLLTRLCVFETAELVATDADADSAMVTGPTD